MTARLAVGLILAAGLASGQLQLFLIDAPGSEVPAPGSVDVGSVPSGDYVDTRFRIRNVGAEMVDLERLRVLGAGFTLRNHPSTPVSIQPGSNVDFRVRFRPANFGSYSASLTVNDIGLLLLGRSPASLTLSVLEEDAWQPLGAGDTVLFGSVLRKSSSTRRLRIHNPASALLSLSGIAIGDGPFHSVDLPAAPLQVEPNGSVDFSVEYAPLTNGIHQSTLAMDGRQFLLEGFGTDPPFPEPEIVFESVGLTSGEQARVRVRLADKPTTWGSGELRIEFVPGVEGAADDPAVQFTATGTRTIPLTVAEESTEALLGGAREAIFQTGTTAGTITFTAVLGTHTVPLSFTVSPEVVQVDSAAGRQIPTGLEVEVAGFDNTHSVSGVAFRFFDRQNNALTQGAIEVDVAQAFRSYFLSAHVGGMFSLLARFPVAGDVSLIGFVEVGFVNSVGASVKRRATF